MIDKRVAVIGAGCTGLAMIKGLKDRGIKEIVCFEQNEAIGGNWLYSAEKSHSSVMSTTHIISSKKLSEFRDYPMPDHYPDYPSHEQVLAYFNDYADEFKLRAHIRLGTKVNQALLRDDSKWEITTEDSSEVFDYLIVANGHHSMPRHAEMLRQFAGEYMHAHAFKNNSQVKGKRVLVVGGGNSACDCAVESGRVAEHVTISMRRPHYIIPKFLMGKPTDTFNEKLLWVPSFILNPMRKLMLRFQIGSYESYGLKTPDFGITEDHPTLNSELLYFIRHGKVKPQPAINAIDGRQVSFENGHKEEYDTIIAATGYKISTPFLDKSIVDYEDADRIELYLRMFHPDYPTLIFAGLVQPQGAIWPLSEAQSKIAAAYVAGDYKMPDDIGAFAAKEADDIEHQYLKRKRHTIEVDFHGYLKQLNGIITNIQAAKKSTTI